VMPQVGVGRREGMDNTHTTKAGDFHAGFEQEAGREDRYR
jgi:hypothetical protein